MKTKNRVHNTTQQTSYSTIGAAVDEAVDGDVIEVDSGTYREPFHFCNKRIVIKGLGKVIIMPPDDEDFIFYFGEGCSMPTGFTFMNVPKSTKGIPTNLDAIRQRLTEAEAWTESFGVLRLTDLSILDVSSIFRLLEESFRDRDLLLKMVEKS